MTDTQRIDMLGCYGNRDMKTPNLDRMAGEGILFERAYTCQPVCGPARSAIFTGTWPHSNGSWANCMALGDNIKTIGQRLLDNGFHTAYIGKWHLDGSDYFGNGLCPDGWDPDYWYDMRCYLEELIPSERIRSRQVSACDDPMLGAAFTYGHRCSERAIKFLKNHHQEDFFLTVSYDEPHHPFLCPKIYSDMYRDYTLPKSRNIKDDLSGKPEHHRIWAGNRLFDNKDSLAIKAPEFFGCNSFVDSEIGRVLSAVDEYAPDALVIYTSDHGDMLHAHSLNGKGPAVYDEITHIPFIVRWKGTAPQKVKYSFPVSHINIVPTILDAAGIPLPKTMEGPSILPALCNPGQKIQDMIFMEFNRYETDHDGFGGFQPLRAVFDGQYKLAVNLLSSDELYDLEKDPQEMKNLINDETYAQTRNFLHDKILEWMNNTRDPFRGYYWERRPWRSNAREATWEYTGMTRQRENEEYEPRQLDYDTGIDMKSPVRDKRI